MYGTIFKLQVKPGHEQALLSLLKDQTPPDGAVAWFVMKPDDNDGEMVATAIGNSHNCDTSSRIHLTVSSVSGGKGGLVMSKSTSGYFAWSAEMS